RASLPLPALTPSSWAQVIWACDSLSRRILQDDLSPKRSTRSLQLHSIAERLGGLPWDHWPILHATTTKELRFFRGVGTSPWVACYRIAAKNSMVSSNNSRKCPKAVRGPLPSRLSVVAQINGAEMNRRLDQLAVAFSCAGTEMKIPTNHFATRKK